MKIWRSEMPFVVMAVVAISAGCESMSEPEQPSEPAVPTASTRLMVQLEPNQNVVTLRESSAAYFGDEAKVEPLFPDIDDPELARYFLVVAPQRDATASPWDVAYEFQAHGEFSSVEPDLADTLQPEIARTRASGACLFDGANPNPDLAWSLRNINVESAWQMTPPGNGKSFGEGVRICHPDTGWKTHDDLDTLDLGSAWNVIDGSSDAEDPLNSGSFLNPGHGTATGSVIGSDGGVASGTGTTGPGRITGVAPAATLVPIRTVNSVIQLFDSDVAQAVAYSVKAQCDVVSMSLGGRAFRGLKRAVNYAVDNGLIVVAAAGNCVGMVVAPAAYKNAIAVTATNDQDKPWSGSSRGRAVAVAAPGENVWVANMRSTSNTLQDISASNGTSFAVAEVAGAAALWLGYHGRARVETAAGSGSVNALFTEILQDTARVPGGWNSAKYGSGILDAKALLAKNLGAGRTPTPPAAAGFDESVTLLAMITDRSETNIERALSVMLDAPVNVGNAAANWAPELIDIALRDPAAFNRALDKALSGSRDPTTRQAAGSEIDTLLSDSLRSALQ